MLRAWACAAPRFKATSSSPIAPAKTVPSWRLSRPLPGRASHREDNYGETTFRKSLAQKHLLNFEPVVDTFVPRHTHVVRGTVQDSLTFESAQLPWIVVDQIIGAQNTLIATIDNVRCRDKWKVLCQP